MVRRNPMTKTLQQLVAEKEITFNDLLRDFLVQQLAWEKSESEEKDILRGSPVLQEMAEKKYDALKSFLSTSLREIAEAAIAAVMVEKKDITKYISTRLTEESEMLIAAECTGFNSAIAESHSHAEEFLKG